MNWKEAIEKVKALDAQPNFTEHYPLVLHPNQREMIDYCKKNNIRHVVSEPIPESWQ